MAACGMRKKDCQAAATLADSSRETNGPHVFLEKHVSRKWIVCDRRGHDSRHERAREWECKYEETRKRNNRSSHVNSFLFSFSRLNADSPAMRYNQRIISFSLYLNPAGNTAIFHATRFPSQRTLNFYFWTRFASRTSSSERWQISTRNMFVRYSAIIYIPNYLIEMHIIAFYRKLIVHPLTVLVFAFQRYWYECTLWK